MFILLQLSHAPSFCILVVSPLNPLHIFPSLVHPGLTSSIDLSRPVCACLVTFWRHITFYLHLPPNSKEPAFVLSTGVACAWPS
ncbi:uncharacterized protein B0J16DRAFT_62477 [Fusarium flagelliforme]|uniref:uncharacterized protein n=1 Tax=Fusarium flagelliforme TaxID=2675880 RepID=UPI001E8E2610|nr:uncharacterized protein B0J16DRAFT_62477 [Fusarium flagelliforme]KAH7192562.1 hypothetical protein B0J16DRAFT_62477 [Fusarium flagelliforme]